MKHIPELELRNRRNDLRAIVKALQSAVSVLGCDLLQIEVHLHTENVHH